MMCPPGTAIARCAATGALAGAAAGAAGGLASELGIGAFGTSAIAGGSGNAASQLLTTGRINPAQLATAALTSGALGYAGSKVLSHLGTSDLTGNNTAADTSGLDQPVSETGPATDAGPGQLGLPAAPERLALPPAPQRLALPSGGPSAGQTVYRVYGGDSLAGGASWSPVDPGIVPNFRDAAGLPSGGASGAANTGRFVIEGTLNDPSAVVLQRNALPLDGMKGGISEYIIPNWINNGTITIRGVYGVNPEF